MIYVTHAGDKEKGSLMGHFCGWSGKDVGSDQSRDFINRMLAAYGEVEHSESKSFSNTTGALAIHRGLYATSLHECDGINAAVVGSPCWDDEELSSIAREHGAAAALSKAYRRSGTDLFARLHGPFALAVLDGDKALVAVDRSGIHTLSYAMQDGLFVFATSTGSVVRHPLITPRIDPQAIFNYFYFYDIPSPGTIFCGVEKLLPAQYVRFQSGQVEKGFYWQLRYDDNNKAPFETQQRQLHALLRKAVGEASQDGPAATFLSGGTDSSTITGVFAELQAKPVDSYSIGFGVEGFDEMQYARLAAQHFGANVHEYYLKPDDVLEAIPLIARTYDEPFANESAVPAYFCAKRAAEDGFKVMLAGDGGDEIFGGNERYAKQMLFEHYSRLPGFLCNYLIEPFAFGFPGGNALLPIRKLRSYIRQAKTPLPERMESYNFVYRQPLEEMFEPDFLSAVNPALPRAMLQDAYFRANSAHPVNRMLHLDLKFTLADNDLRKVSRMCEAAGIKVRYPMLDEALVEFSGQLPVHFKVRGQNLRWFFKEALKDFLPREIITKSKHGFGLPFGVWALSHPALREYVNESLEKFGGRGYLCPAYIETHRQLHAEEHATYFGKMIWVIITLEAWLQAHVPG